MNNTDSKNVREILKILVDLIKATYDLKDDEKPTVGLIISLPPEYDKAHYITNTTRDNGIKMFQRTADRMRSEVN